MVLGPDNTLYVLRAGGILDACLSGSSTVTTLQTNVVSLLSASDGTLYKLQTDGSLYDLKTGAGWVLVKQKVKSISGAGASINVMETNGTYSQFDGVNWTWVAGPHLALVASAASAAGQPVSLTLTVLDYFNSTASAYAGTVHFTSSDAGAVLPASYTFTAADAGVHAFNGSLVTSGSQTLTAIDNSAPTPTTASATVNVSPGPAVFFSVTPAGPTAIAGSVLAITVRAVDAYGNLAPSYIGTVHLSSTDPAAVMPPDYSMVAADLGTHTFSSTFKTAAGILVTATAVPPSPMAGSSVPSPAPTGSQITGSGTVLDTPAALDLSQTSVSLAPGSLILGGTTIVTLTAKDAYGNQQLHGGLPITFGLGAGIGSGTFSPITDNGDGTYSATFTGTVVGSNSITANVGALVAMPAAVTVAKVPVSLSMTPSITSPYTSQSLRVSVAVNGGIPNGETVLVKDASNANAVVGTATVNAGLATIVVPAGTLTAGTHNLFAVYGGNGNYAAAISGNMAFTILPTSTLVLAGSSLYLRENTDGINLDIWQNSATPGVGAPTTQAILASISMASYAGTAGNDVFTLDFSKGNPLPPGGVSIDGAGGVNTLSIIGTLGSDTVNIGSNGLTFTGSTFSNVPINVANVQTIQFHGGSGGNDALNLMAGSYTLDADTPTGTPNVAVTVGAAATASFTTNQHLASLSINGGLAKIASATRSTVWANAFALTANGTMDLGVSDLVLGGTTAAAAQAMVARAVDPNSSNAAGYSLWDGIGGITSSAAKADAALNSPKTLAIGIADASDNAYVNWPGSPAGDGTIPVGYTVLSSTVYGDINLDHKVDINDFNIWQAAYTYQGVNDPNFSHKPDRWAMGDITYDGIVDINDFNYWQVAYTKPATPTSPQASSGLSAVSTPMLIQTPMVFMPPFPVLSGLVPSGILNTSTGSSATAAHRRPLSAVEPPLQGHHTPKNHRKAQRKQATKKNQSAWWSRTP